MAGRTKFRLGARSWWRTVADANSRTEHARADWTESLAVLNSREETLVIPLCVAEQRRAARLRAERAGEHCPSSVGA